MFAPEPVASERRSPRCCSSARSTAASAGASCCEASQTTVRRTHPDATLTIVGDQGPPCAGVTYRIGVTDAELADALSACVGLRVAEHVRGVRSSVSRSDGVRHARRRVAEPWKRRGARSGQVRCAAVDEEFGGRISSLLADEARRAALSARGSAPRARSSFAEPHARSLRDTPVRPGGDRCHSPWPPSSIAGATIPSCADRPRESSERVGGDGSSCSSRVSSCGVRCCSFRACSRTALHSRAALRRQRRRARLLLPARDGRAAAASSRWLLASFALLAANLLHGHAPEGGPRADRLPDQHRRADVLDGPRRCAANSDCARLLWVIFAASLLSAVLGVLQVYFPERVPAAGVQRAGAKSQPRRSSTRCRMSERTGVRSFALQV